MIGEICFQVELRSQKLVIDGGGGESLIFWLKENGAPIRWIIHCHIVVKFCKHHRYIAEFFCAVFAVLSFVSTRNFLFSLANNSAAAFAFNVNNESE